MSGGKIASPFQARWSCPLANIPVEWLRHELEKKKRYAKALAYVEGEVEVEG
jgi:hypothetical protein